MMNTNYHSKIILTAIIISLCVTLFPINTANATISVAVCEQAISTANGVYEKALKNTKDYPTPADAIAAADRYFAKRISAEFGTTVVNRKAGISACAHGTSKSAKYYTRLFTY